jgi:hypothetical protein
MATRHRIGADLFSDEEYRMLGEALQMAEPLPPGQDWDYFNDDQGEMGDTENPAVDAVFNWGQPLIGRARSVMVGRHPAVRAMGTRRPTLREIEGTLGPLYSGVGMDAEICERSRR